MPGGILWVRGVLYIDGEPANRIAKAGVAAGLITPKRPRFYRTPEEEAAYRKRRRAYQTECMRRLRRKRKAEAEALAKLNARAVG